MPLKQDLKTILQRVEAAGCEVIKTNGGHYKVLVPGGGIVVIAKTPTDWRSFRNVRADLRRAGVDI